MIHVLLRTADPARDRGDVSRLCAVLAAADDLDHAGERGPARFTVRDDVLPCVVEGLLKDPVEAVGLVLAVIRTGAWVAGLVASTGAPDPDRGVGDGEVEAAVLERVLHRAAASTGRCALELDGAAGDASARRRQDAAEAALQLLGVLEQRRSEPQQEAGRLVESGASQREAAAALEVTQQAVHARLRNGLWHETRTLAAAVAALVAPSSRTTAP